VDSVTEALTAHLSQVSGLHVISRTSARQYKKTGKRLPEIGTELQVDGVVEGAVTRAGAGVRITVKLIRAATDRNVWTQLYDGDMRHMLAVQQRMASDVAVAAGRPQRAVGGSARPIDPNAYDAYVKGLTAKGLQRYEGFRRAVAYFDEAIAIQPDFGEAHAALAHAQVQLLFGGPLSPHEAVPKAEAAARRALQLDPSLVHAHWALGQILSLYHWRWEEGAQALLRADALGGEREELTTALSESLVRRGRIAEAIAVAERGRKADPLSVSTQIAVGNAYRAAGQHGRALVELAKALEMSPATPRVHFHVGITYVMMGRLDDAIRSLETAQQGAQAYNTRMQAYLGYAYAAANRTRDARKILAELETRRRTQYVSSFGIAVIHDALADKTPALAALQRACDERAVEFALIRQYPPFKAIASDPSFEAILQKVGLPR
jgi:TolB-like protein/thioredoxin-like negative regulator of GroEL